MSYQKLQTGRALDVYPSDIVQIPDASTKVLAATGDFSIAAKLTTTGQSFTTAGIVPGTSIIYNTTDGIAYGIQAIDNDNSLTVIGAVGGAAANFVIYARPTNGCVLYVGKSGDINVQMAADKEKKFQAADCIEFTNIPDSAFLPIQVVGVAATDTTAQNIIALW